jgi:hypothetical protein
VRLPRMGGRTCGRRPFLDDASRGTLTNRILFSCGIHDFERLVFSGSPRNTPSITLTPEGNTMKKINRAQAIAIAFAATVGLALAPATVAFAEHEEGHNPPGASYKCGEGDMDPLATTGTDVTLNAKVGDKVDATVPVTFAEVNAGQAEIVSVTPAPPAWATAALVHDDAFVTNLKLSGTPTAVSKVVHTVVVCAGMETVTFKLTIDIAAADVVVVEKKEEVKKLAETGAVGTLELGALALLLVGAGVVAQQVARRRSVKA